MRLLSFAFNSSTPAPSGKYPSTGKRRCRFHGGLSTGPKTAEGRAAISAANTKHGRYKNWREKQAKEKYYLGEIKRVMREARAAGLLKEFLLSGLAAPLSQAVG